MFSRALQKAIAPAEPMSWAEAICVSAMAVLSSLPLIVGLYLLKSAAGINLLPGPSPLHDLLYHFVR
jgi:hypothetical protein